MKAASALVGILALAAMAPRTAAQEPPLPDDLLARAGRYVQGFQHDFESVISDETYVQRERQSRIVDGRERVAAATRTIASETLFMWVAEDQSWLMVRNVLKVDGRAVPDSRARLERTLAEPAALGPSGHAPALGFEPVVSRFRRLRDESARFNLGRIIRNLNDPMLPFQFVDPRLQPRFAFSIAGQEPVNGVSTWKVTFAERASPQTPTIVTVDQRNAPSNGEVWVTASGIVMRTRITLRSAITSLVSSIVVTYGRDPKLAGWVPIRMEETYTERPPQASGVRTEISCIATYTNFRRFETSGRIVPPK